MKTCTRCKNDLSIDKFPIVNKKTGKISAMCGDCKRAYDVEYWNKNKLVKKKNKNEKVRLNRIKKRIFILNILKKSKCKDCGNSDWRVLEFDHRNRKTKWFEIANAAHYSIENIKKEIDKCDIVCSNCHSIRTIEQRGYYKF